MQFLELSTIQWIALVASAFLVGLTKAGFGAGAGILPVPMMAIALGGSEDMLPVMLPVLICGDVFSIIHYPKAIEWRNIAMLVPSCIFGVAVGTIPLMRIYRNKSAQGGVSSVLDLFVGAICLAFLVVQVWRYFRESRLTERPEPYRPKVWHGIVTGIVAGVTSTLAHAAGSLIALFLLPQKLDKRVFVGTCVMYFFFGNLVKFAPYAALGLFTTPRVWTAVVILPAVVVGTVAGLVLAKKFSGKAFTLFVYVCTLAAVLKMLYDSLVRYA
jgi:hypothetical protein